MGKVDDKTRIHFQGDNFNVIPVGEESGIDDYLRDNRVIYRRV